MKFWIVCYSQYEILIIIIVLSINSWFSGLHGQKSLRTTALKKFTFRGVESLTCALVKMYYIYIYTI
jgi:hypothetical protein